MNDRNKALLKCVKFGQCNGYLECAKSRMYKICRENIYS